MGCLGLQDTTGRRDLEANQETWVPPVPKVPPGSLGLQAAREKTGTRGAQERRGTRGSRARQARRAWTAPQGRKENQVAPDDQGPQVCPAPSGCRDSREKKESLGRRVTQERSFLDHLGQKGPPALRASRVFLDQRGKRGWTEPGESRVSRERKETEGLWDSPALRDQLEFQAQQDQRESGAAKATPE